MSKELDAYKAIAALEMSAMRDDKMTVEKAEELRQIIEKELEDLDTIKKIFADYGLSFKLTTLREAVFLLKQLQNEKSQCWDNALKKLKALEIIKNIGILKPYETIGGQCWLETMSDATKITKDSYDLLKEVGL